MIDLNSMDSDRIELMTDYFNSRVDVYDEIHSQIGISWGKQIRDIISDYIPKSQCKILDLGCGTGLELEKILEKNPNAEIICVDISEEMLKKLKDKYPQENIKIVNQDFLLFDFSLSEYDFVISVMALHHFFEEEKKFLYSKIYNCLKEHGIFINSDYIIDDEIFSMQRIDKYREIKINNPNGLFHFDIPFTEKNETKVLIGAGFNCIDNVYENKKTKVLVARK